MKRYKIDNNHVVDVPDEVFSAIRYYSYKERYLKMKDAKHKNPILYDSFYMKYAKWVNITSKQNVIIRSLSGLGGRSKWKIP